MSAKRYFCNNILSRNRGPRTVSFIASNTSAIYQSNICIGIVPNSIDDKISERIFLASYRISRRRNIYYLPYGNGYNGYGFSGFQTVPSGNARTGNRNRAESNSTQTSVIQTTAAATNVSTRSTNIRRASFIGTSPSQNGGKRSAPKGSKKH